MRTVQEIAQDVATQDNAITELPVFIVQQRKRLYGIDDSYATESVWVDKDDWSEVEDLEKIKELDAAEKNGDDIEDYERCGIRDEWEFVTACFTRVGCEEYLRVNGHNLTDPRIYVASGYRNTEWETMRKYLLGMVNQ
jgi:hypothetical protein